MMRYVPPVSDQAWVVVFQDANDLKPRVKVTCRV